MLIHRDDRSEPAQTGMTPVPFVVALLREYVQSEDQLLIDVGCGPALYRDATPGQYVGVDLTLHPYGRVDRHADVVAAADDLPFPNASVDVVFSKSALYQFPDPEAALNEFHRVLRLGGRLLLIDYNRRVQSRLEQTESAARPRWTALGLRSRVRRSGFRDVELLLPAVVQPRGLRRLVALIREELRGQWAIVTGVRR
jgi:SAM-dependent methyltransferase